MPASGPRRPRARLVLAVVAACLALAGIILALVLALGSPPAGHITQQLLPGRSAGR